MSALAEVLEVKLAEADITMNELARRAGVSHTHVGRMARHLEDAERGTAYKKDLLDKVAHGLRGVGAHIPQGLLHLAAHLDLARTMDVDLRDVVRDVANNQRDPCAPTKG